MTLIRFDECLSYRIVEAMRALGVPEGVVLQHPNEIGEHGRDDVDWIASFRAGGGRCIVTGDPKMRGRQGLLGWRDAPCSIKGEMARARPSTPRRFGIS